MGFWSYRMAQYTRKQLMDWVVLGEFRFAEGHIWWQLVTRLSLSPLTTPVCMILCREIKTYLTHWGRVTHICVGNLTIIGSVNGLSPGRRKAITWTNAGLLLIGPLGTNFSEMLFGIQTLSFKKIHFKTSSAKWRPFCFGLNVLNLRDATSKI